ncbi:MAG TPA: ABC transporter ATP-binding protein [Candidatus Baltobacteraceae bacterium]|nr:ABC transporter ATP-binding protein [Candidatus Baltobacteraceae bacterium]
MILEAENLTKFFGGLAALKEVSFGIAEGEILGLIGPNGAGKTTLFNVLSGAFRSDQGRVVFAGEDVSRLGAPRRCRTGLVRTFQVVKPFSNLSVLQNVMVGSFLRTPDPGLARERALEVMELVGLGARQDQPAKSLTVSDRKRLEVARALATRPRLLLLDEVMAGLTPTELVEMLETLKKIRDRGVTLLVIEHIMAAILTISERILVLHHGEKIADGAPKAVAGDKRVIDAYLGEEYLLA